MESVKKVQWANFFPSENYICKDTHSCGERVRQGTGRDSPTREDDRLLEAVVLVSRDLDRVVEELRDESKIGHTAGKVDRDVDRLN